MLKQVLFLTIFLTSSLSWGSCVVGSYEFSAHLSEATFDASYEDGEAYFTNDDHIEVRDTVSGRVQRFEFGRLTDDQTGNFTIEAATYKGLEHFEVIHDHETWHQGLEGSFKLDHKGETIDLSQVRNCSFDKLF